MTSDTEIEWLLTHLHNERLRVRMIDTFAAHFREKLKPFIGQAMDIGQLGNLHRTMRDELQSIASMFDDPLVLEVEYDPATPGRIRIDRLVDQPLRNIDFRLTLVD